MLNPAATVIERCGGVNAVAKMVGRHPSRVRRWAYSKDRGGTGGLVPTDLQSVLLLAAHKQGRDLLPEHFFKI